MITSDSKKCNTLPIERQDSILQYIRTHGSAQIKELSVLMGVSEATIRRDLDELDHSGKVERTHGGAICNHNGTSFERKHEEKMSIMEEEKRRIAQAAASFVSEGDTIFLDSGTTTFLLGTLLSDIPNLTIITYDIIIAYSLALHPTSTLIVTGGVRRSGYNNVLIGVQTENFLRDLHVDKTFLGADAIDINFGVSNSNYMEAEVKKQAAKIGRHTFLLTDHSKFGNTALSKVCSLDEIDVLITDKNTPQSFVNPLKKAIKKVLFV